MSRNGSTGFEECCTTFSVWCVASVVVCCSAMQCAYSFYGVLHVTTMACACVEKCWSTCTFSVTRINTEKYSRICSVRVTHESCHTFECESCHTSKRMGRVTHMNVSCVTRMNKRVMSYVCIQENTAAASGGCVCHT